MTDWYHYKVEDRDGFKYQGGTNNIVAELSLILSTRDAKRVIIDVIKEESNNAVDE